MAVERVTLRDGSEHEGQLPSPGRNQYHEFDAPSDYAGGFFNTPLPPGVERAPVDAETGVPLPIAPRSDLGSIPRNRLTVHHHCFPYSSPLLQTRGGKALRVSRLQLVTLPQHNHGKGSFHNILRAGPILPEDEDGQVGQCAISVAHYLPENVVDISTGESLVRTRRDWEYRRLSETGELSEQPPPKPRQVQKFRNKWLPGVPLLDAKQELVSRRLQQAELRYRFINYGLDPIRDLFAGYVLGQDLSEVKPALRRKFMREGGAEDGLRILGVAAVLASQRARVKDESLDVVYARLHRQGRLHPRMPERAGSLIMHKLGNYAGRTALLPELRARLQSTAQGTVGQLAAAA
jgi:hypothetical protein